MDLLCQTYAALICNWNKNSMTWVGIFNNCLKQNHLENVEKKGSSREAKMCQTLEWNWGQPGQNNGIKEASSMNTETAEWTGTYPFLCQDRI
jgi:hypothetical protein